ncbi:MAG: hypothetical protein MH204_06240 [Fimbriimonadaceae bacterium]|nr:hypothetical protein [Fimbriimonadaceae bacterium]
MRGNPMELRFGPEEVSARMWRVLMERHEARPRPARPALNLLWIAALIFAVLGVLRTPAPGQGPGSGITGFLWFILAIAFVLAWAGFGFRARPKEFSLAEARALAEGEWENPDDALWLQIILRILESDHPAPVKRKMLAELEDAGLPRERMAEDGHPPARAWRDSAALLIEAVPDADRFRSGLASLPNP